MVKERRKAFSIIGQLIIAIAMMFCLMACAVDHSSAPLCEIWIGSSKPKAINSLLYGPVDYDHLDVDDYLIYYRAVPLESTNSTYGGTGDYYKRLSSSQEPFVLSQGKWHIEIKLLQDSNTETTIHKNAILSKTILEGELDTYINIYTKVLTFTQCR